MANSQVRKYYFVLCVLLLCSTSLVQAQVKSTNVQTIEGKKYYIHKIEKSQSLYAISKLYNVTVDDLYKINPELKAGAKANQDIKIPYNGPAIATPAVTTVSAAAIDTNRFLTHRIIKGETMYSIGRKFNLSEKELLSYNPTMTQGLREGQLISLGEKNRKKFTIKPAPEIRTPTPPKEKPASVPVDSSVFKVVAKPKKSSYRVALMLPFKLDQTLALDNNELARSNANFPAVPALAVDFYLGFKKALDSLSTNGFDLNLDLFDVDEKDSLKTSLICAAPEFKQLDLIIGPLHPNTFKTVSKKAKEAGIPIVSPFTTQNKILHNNNIISKTNPSQFTLSESLADYIIDSLAKSNANVILMTMSDRDKKESSFVSAFKKYYNEKQKSLGKPARDTVTLAKGMAGVRSHYKQGTNNIIVCLSANQVFITDFATQLALFADNKDITLCGWQSITEIDNLDQAYLEHLHYTFPHQYNTTNLAPYKGLIEDYKRSQETSPTEYYYLGFDIGYYYLTNLREKGPDFIQTLDQSVMETNYMRFKFSRPDRATGYDNRGVYIFKYKDFQINRTGWK